MKNILTADFLGFDSGELVCSVVLDVAKAKLEETKEWDCDLLM